MPPRPVNPGSWDELHTCFEGSELNIDKNLSHGFNYTDEHRHKFGYVCGPTGWICQTHVVDGTILSLTQCHECGR